MHLICSAGCTGSSFTAIDPVVTVAQDGTVERCDTAHCTFVCSLCQAPALDLVQAGKAMQEHNLPHLLLCPSCETELLPPEDPSGRTGPEASASVIVCPACGAEFSVEEASPRLAMDSFEEES